MHCVWGGPRSHCKLHRIMDTVVGVHCNGQKMHCMWIALHWIADTVAAMHCMWGGPSRPCESHCIGSTVVGMHCMWEGPSRGWQGCKSINSGFHFESIDATQRIYNSYNSPFTIYATSHFNFESNDAIYNSYNWAFTIQATWPSDNKVLMVVMEQFNNSIRNTSIQ